LPPVWIARRFAGAIRHEQSLQGSRLAGFFFVHPMHLDGLDKLAPNPNVDIF
jgi:hypothetical protein